MTSKQLAYAIIAAIILFLVVYFAKKWGLTH